MLQGFHYLLQMSKIFMQAVMVTLIKKVPFTERVKISSTNVRLETTVPQKEETFQVFWYIIKKVQGIDSYEFLLANKKCVVNADVFRTILDICPRVEGVNFTNVPDDHTALTFLIEHAYKGPLYKNTNMFVDYMHQPWRTLAAIINKCLSGKTTSNDKLRKSRIDIPWGMFYRENVNYHELIWEDLAFQIDHKKEKRSRREDYQEYGLPILETMLTEAIKQSESYQMFIKYSTADDPDVALELGKSISKTEAEASRQVHATHVRIVTESVLEPTRRRKSGKVTSDPPKKLKGVPSLL
ncbi:hypothetical protein Tco_0672101 [Tanacetum coccineum]